MMFEKVNRREGNVSKGHKEGTWTIKYERIKNFYADDEEKFKKNQYESKFYYHT